MLTRKALDAAWRHKIAYSDLGPHRFGGPEPQWPSSLDYPQQTVAGPDDYVRLWNPELLTYVQVRLPYVGEPEA